MASRNYPEWFHHLMPRHGVILRRGEGDRGEARDPGAIRSRLPEVWVDYPPPERFSGRSRKVVLAAPRAFVSLRARLRPPVEGPSAGEVRTGFARDWRNRPVPIWQAEPATRTIRVLADFARAPVLDHTFLLHPGEFVLGKMIEEPLAALLAADGKPFIGSRVRSRLARMLRRHRRDPRKRLREELAFLRGLRPRPDDLPSPLQRHMEIISRRLSELSEPPPPEPVAAEFLERQLEQLCRIVEKRTCSVLRFEEGRVSGVVNPAADGPHRARAPLEFFLAVDPEFFRPCLYVSAYAPGAPRRRYPRCLGGGATILNSQYRERDLFSMVDTVLNYIETNRVGLYRRPVLPAGPPPVQGKLPLLRGEP